MQERKVLILKQDASTVTVLTQSGKEETLEISEATLPVGSVISIDDGVRRPDWARGYSLKFLTVSNLSEDMVTLSSENQSVRVSRTLFGTAQLSQTVVLYWDGTQWLFGQPYSEQLQSPMYSPQLMSHMCRVPLRWLARAEVWSLTIEEHILKLSRCYPVCKAFPHSALCWLQVLFHGLVETCMRVNQDDALLNSVQVQVANAPQLREFFDFMQRLKNSLNFRMSLLQEILQTVTSALYLELEQVLQPETESVTSLIIAFSQRFSLGLCVIDSKNDNMELFNKEQPQRLIIVCTMQYISLLYNKEQILLDEFSLGTLKFPDAAPLTKFWHRRSPWKRELHQTISNIIQSDRSMHFRKLYNLSARLLQHLDGSVYDNTSQEILSSKCRQCHGEMLMQHQCQKLVCQQCIQKGAHKKNLPAILIGDSNYVRCPECDKHLTPIELARCIDLSRSEHSHRAEPMKGNYFNSQLFTYAMPCIMCDKVGLRTVTMRPCCHTFCIDCKPQNDFCSACIPFIQPDEEVL